MDIKELLKYELSEKMKIEMVILLENYFLSKISREECILVLGQLHELLINDKISLLHMYHMGDGEYSYVINVKKLYDKIDYLYSSYSEENFMASLLTHIENNYDSNYGSDDLVRSNFKNFFSVISTSLETNTLDLNHIISSNNPYVNSHLILIFNTILIENNLEDDVAIEILKYLYNCSNNGEYILPIRTEFEDEPRFEIDVVHLYIKVFDLYCRYPKEKIVTEVLNKIISFYTEAKITYDFHLDYQIKIDKEANLQFQFDIINNFLSDQNLLQNPLVESYININEHLEKFKNKTVTKEELIDEFSRFSLIFNDKINDEDLIWPDFQPFKFENDDYEEHQHINNRNYIKKSQKLENLNTLYSIEITALKEKIATNLLLLFIEDPDFCQQEKEYIPLFLDFINYLPPENLLSFHTRFTSHHVDILSQYKEHSQYKDYILKTFSIYNKLNNDFPFFLLNLIKKGNLFNPLFIETPQVNSLASFWTSQLFPYINGALPLPNKKILDITKLNDLLKQLTYYCLNQSLNNENNIIKRVKL